MSRLRPVRARTMTQFLKSQGFAQIRQRGSHRGEDLGRSIIRSILRDLDVAPREFLTWLNS